MGRLEGIGGTRLAASGELSSVACAEQLQIIDFTTTPYYRLHVAWTPEASGSSVPVRILTILSFTSLRTA
jgi:hypothetical protein